MNNKNPQKLNIILKLLIGLGSILSKLRIKCSSKCCVSDCMLNEEQKIKKKESFVNEEELK